MIVTVANQKGGVGKTALTACLSTVIDGPVTLIDADPQANLTQWCISHLDEDGSADAYERSRKLNLMSVLRGESIIKNSTIEINSKLELLSAVVDLDRSRTEFQDHAGAELIMRSCLEEYDSRNRTILIDTAGELSLLSTMMLACADMVLIPVGTQLMPIDSLSITLQRIGQVQQRLNPRLKNIAVIPSLYNQQRKTNVASLSILVKHYSTLLLRNMDETPVVFHNRAEVESLMHSLEPLSQTGLAVQTMREICRQLRMPSR